MSTPVASTAASRAGVTVLCEPTPVGRKGREMSGRKMSAAAVKRLMKAEAQRLAALEVAHAEIDEEREAFLASFVPRRMPRERWEEHAPFLRDLMRRSNMRGQATFGQLMSELSLYADWALDAGVEMSIEGLLRHDLIERWIAERGDGQSPTWGNRRSRLRNLASHVNPGPSAPRRGTPFSRAAVKAPYTLRELADLERLALNQPSAASRRNLCTMLALGAGAGAGLSSSSGARPRRRPRVTQSPKRTPGA